MNIEIFAKKIVVNTIFKDLFSKNSFFKLRFDIFIKKEIESWNNFKLILNKPLFYRHVDFPLSLNTFVNKSQIFYRKANLYNKTLIFHNLLNEKSRKNWILNYS